VAHWQGSLAVGAVVTDGEEIVARHQRVAGPLFHRATDGMAMQALTELSAAGASTTAADALELLWDDLVGLRD
jgi:hypothetical protein